MSAFNAKAITENVNDITLVSPDGAKNKFCEVWPQAKSGLDLLQQIIKNPIAKAAIGIVITAGDAIASKIC